MSQEARSAASDSREVESANDRYAIEHPHGDWHVAPKSAAPSRGPIHDLDAGTYRVVIRDGVPRIERETTAGAVRQILVPCSPEIVAELSADWSEPVQWRIEDGEFVFRTVPA